MENKRPTMIWRRLYPSRRNPILSKLPLSLHKTRLLLNQQKKPIYNSQPKEGHRDDSMLMLSIHLQTRLTGQFHLLIAKIQGGRLMCASFKRIMLITALIVRLSKGLKVLLKRMRIWMKVSKKIRKEKSLEPKEVQLSKQRQRRRKLGQGNTQQQMKFLIVKSQTHMTTEILMDLILLIL